MSTPRSFERLGVMGLGGLLIHPLGLGLAIGSIVGGLLFPEPQDQTQFTSLQIQTSAKGNPVPVVYGTQRLTGNVIWYANFKVNSGSGGKGGKGGGGGGKGKGQQATTYQADFAIGICEGPCKILRIWAGQSLLYADPASPVGGYNTGANGTTFRIYAGDGAQTVDPTIAADTTGGLPQLAYRWTCYVVFPSYNLGETPTVPNFSFEVQRLLSNSDIFFGHKAGAAVKSGAVYSETAGTWGSFMPPGLIKCPFFWADENNCSPTGRPLTMTAYGTPDNVFFSWWYTLTGGTLWLNPATMPYGLSHMIICPDGTLVGLLDGPWSATQSGPQYTRSTDGGATWAVPTYFPSMEGGFDSVGGIYVGCQLESNIVRDISNNLYAMGAYGLEQFGYPGQNQIIVWKSTDQGNSWSVLKNILSPGWVVYAACLTYRYTSSGEVFFISGSGLFGVGGCSVLRSTDKGVSWTTVFNDTTTYYLSIAGTHRAAFTRNCPSWCANGDWLLFVTAGSTSLPHAFRSTDNGVTWVLDDSSIPSSLSGLTSFAHAGFMVAWGDNSKGVFATDCNPTVGGGSPTGYTYLGATISDGSQFGTFVSTDGGKTWTALSVEPGTDNQPPYRFFSPSLLNPSISLLDVRFSDALSDFLCSTRYGAGSSVTQDPTTWSQIQTYEDQFGLYGSPILTDRKQATDHIGDFLSYFDGIFVPSQGVFKLRARQVENMTASLSSADYLEQQPNFVRRAPKETFNRLRLTWTNRSNDYNRDTLESFDDWSINDTGERQNTVQLPGIMSNSLAQNWAQRQLWSLLNRPLATTIPTGMKWESIEQGDVISHTESYFGTNWSGRLRVVSVTREPDNRLGLDVVEEPTSILTWPTFPSPQLMQTRGSQPNLFSDPGYTTPAIFEVPTELPQPWGSAIPVLGIGACGPNSLWAGCNILVSRDNITYGNLYTLTKKATIGSLTTALPEVPMEGLYFDGRGTVTIDLSISGSSASGISFENMIALSKLAYIGGEFISFQNATAQNSPFVYTLQGMRRGVYQSSVNSGVYLPSSKSIGTLFCQIDGSVIFVPLTLNDIGKTIYFKFQSISAFGVVQNLGSCTAYTITPTGWTTQPDPPSHLRLGSQNDLSPTESRSLQFVWNYATMTNFEDIEINSGTIVGYDQTFSSYYIQVFTATSSGGPWTSQVATTVGSETYWYVASQAGFVKTDVAIQNKAGVLSPFIERVWQTL